jgi:hypothetical protein
MPVQIQSGYGHREKEALHQPAECLDEIPAAKKGVHGCRMLCPPHLSRVRLSVSEQGLAGKCPGYPQLPI